MNTSRIQKKAPPHIRTSRTAPIILLDVIISILPLYFMAYIYYGLRVIVLGAIGALTCFLLNLIASALSSQKVNIYNIAPIVTGLLIPLALPAAIDYSIVICACAFSILVVEMPFGGCGFNFFNPAAAGIAFAAFCWPTSVFTYTEPLVKLPVFGKIVASSYSPAYYLKLGAVPKLDLVDLLTGEFVGPMGTSCVFALIAGFIFLLVRKVINWRTVLSYFVAVIAMFALFPRIHSDSISSVLLELCSGSVIFGGIFMVSEPVTAPKRNIPKYIYGFLIGIFTVLFRYYGGFEQGVAFAVLILNIFSPLLDLYSEKVIYYSRRVRIARKPKSSE
ncbi:MAG: RnfABCDGE type electron transport complex subunit D [Oscillospiraceae bacterium]|nr:RnfABCDGE type electron transport complex subunit D [Oscillospiraceae bacterium]